MKKYRPPKCCVCNRPGAYHCEPCKAAAKAIAAAHNARAGECHTLPPDREDSILAMILLAEGRLPLCPDPDRLTVFREAMRA